jgi:hypothetical protein
MEKNSARAEITINSTNTTSQITVKTGKNVVAIMAVNVGPAANPAGLIGCIRIEYEGESLEVDSHQRELGKRQAAKQPIGCQNRLTIRNGSRPRLWEKFGSDPWGEISASDSESEARRIARSLICGVSFGVDKPVKQAIVTFAAWDCTNCISTAERSRSRSSTRAYRIRKAGFLRRPSMSLTN